MLNEKPTAPSCLNCGVEVHGKFCSACGQKVRDNSDRSILPLISELVSGLFLVDNRFWISLKFLFAKPGVMTVQFLQGKRKKFISPVTLFLFFNLIYFFVNPLSDYSLPLIDQTYSQPYSSWIQDWVETDFQNQPLEWSSYSANYQNASDQISKSIMIFNVPIIALIVYCMAFRRRRFYFDSLIFSLHYFTIFICSWVLLDWSGRIIEWLTGSEDSLLTTIVFYFFTFVFPTIYGMISMRKFLGINWLWSILSGIGVLFGVLFANILYRFLIFILAFCVS